MSSVKGIYNKVLNDMSPNKEIATIDTKYNIKYFIVIHSIKKTMSSNREDPYKIEGIMSCDVSSGVVVLTDTLFKKIN